MEIAPMKPFAIELFAGLHGWGAGLIAEGWRVFGFDLVDMCAALGRPRPEGCELVIQDVLTLHGSQFCDASLFVCSPPCTEFSYMAMPFSRGKKIAAALRGRGEFPEGYAGSRTISELTALFDACFRIQREACESAGRYIPMIVENVKGCQPWVGNAKANYGSYYLFGDIANVGGRIMRPDAVRFGMPAVKAARRTKREGRNFHGPERGESSPSFNGAAHETRSVKVGGIKLAEVGFNVAAAQRYRDGLKGPGGDWFQPGKPSPTRALDPGVNHGGDCFSDPNWAGKQGGCTEGFVTGLGKGHDWRQDPSGRFNSKSDSRKAASALIAEIPFELAEHIARIFKP